jgi:hypothetical protein
VEVSARDTDLADDRAPITNGNTDHRMTNGFDSEEDDAPKEPESLDIKLFRNNVPGTERRGGEGRKPHIFSRVNVFRGEWPAIPESNSHSPSQTLVQNYTSPLLFPILSSYPSIFQYPHPLTIDHLTNNTTSNLPLYILQSPQHGLATHTALSSSTSVAERIRGLATVVGRVAGVVEREGLRSDLLRLGEEYVEGWDSGSDEDDD